MTEEKQYYIRIMAPTHIGCDEVYDPTGFLINEDTHALTAFEPMDFFKSLDAQAKSRFADICRKGTIESILELYKFMKGRQLDGHHVGVCKGLIAQYHKTLAISANDRRKIQQELNNFSISRTSFNPTTQKPYIPGSAIKGALRTAYLNHLAKSRNIPAGQDRRDRNPGNTLEKGLLDYQKLENDPFRLLKVSDFHPVGPCRTKIVYAVNVKKVPSKFNARGPYQILEMIEPGSVFAGTIRILEPLTRDVIKTPLSGQAVFESAAAFYEKEKNREILELKAAGLPVLDMDTKDNVCCLRLGRHSGAESLTIEGHRNIKIMKKRGDRPGSSDKATTFWLASELPENAPGSELKPFGWVGLGEMTEALGNKLEEMDKAQESIAVRPVPVRQKTEVPPVEVKAPVEELWENATVTYDAGGAGKISAQMQGKTSALLQGVGNRDNLRAAVSDALHKIVFEKKKPIKARVTVCKVGNNWQIVKVEPAA